MPPPAPTPAPAPASDWATGPLSPGDWRYGPSQNGTGASFPSDISSARLLFAIQCGQRRVILTISGAQSDALLIHTSYGARRLPAGRVHLSEMVVELQPSDPLLDQMAFSRGRFLVQVEGGPSLVVPAWPEFARVVEDCRGQ